MRAGATRIASLNLMKQYINNRKLCKGIVRLSKGLGSQPRENFQVFSFFLFSFLHQLGPLCSAAFASSVPLLVLCAFEFCRVAGVGKGKLRRACCRTTGP